MLAFRRRPLATLPSYCADMAGSCRPEGLYVNKLCMLFMDRS